MTPPAPTSPLMPYASRFRSVILFGGLSLVGNVSILLGDTWAYDLNANTWTNLNPGNAPRVRYIHALAYDSESDRVILFGGAYGSGNATFLLNDTWAYDFNTNTWTNMNPANAPPARYGHAMAYDSRSDRVILSGGFYNDTWPYDSNTNTWTTMTPAVTPPSPRYFTLPSGS